MKRTTHLWLAAALMCLPGLVLAEESPPKTEEETDRSIVVGVLIGEALFAANAGLATMDPKAYGVVGALLFPLGAAETGRSKTTMWAALVAAEGLAAYNIVELDRDKYTDKEVFVANMVAWHVFAAVVGTTAWLKGDLDKPEKVSFRLVPHRDGGLLRVAYAF